jgi:predicted TIM-barrel fold metal-dependent hydrolase
VILDSHSHIEPELGVAGLLKAMDAAGVTSAVLMAAAQQPLGPVNRAGPVVFHACMRIPPLRMPIWRIARRTMHQEPHPDNPSVFEAARENEGRFFPFAFINPTRDDARDELDELIDAGARGVKLHLWFHRYRLTDAIPILERAQGADLPVLAHLGTGPAEDVEIVLERLPKLKLILAHAGLPHLERLWRLPRLNFDVAAPQLVSRGTVGRLVKAVGPERVVFGSDAPIGIRKGDGHRYDPPPLPSRCFGDNLSALL